MLHLLLQDGWLSQSVQLEAGISQVQITIIFFGVALITLLTPKQVLVQLVRKVVVSDLLINKCFVLSYLLVLKYILFLRQKNKFSPLQFQLLQTRSHLSFFCTLTFFMLVLN